MKFIILTIALIAIVQSAPNCASSKYCMGCDGTTADKCTSCYNGSATGVEARYLDTNTCDKKVTALADCTIYKRGMTAAATTSVGNDWVCTKCGSSKFPHINATTAGQHTFAATTTGAITCATTYKTSNDTITAITGCDRTVAITNGANGATYCILCSASKGADAQTTCGATAITNCSQEYWDGTAAACYVPAASYALSAVTGGTPASFTTDANCRVHSSTNCAECKDTYWFSGATCVNSAKMMILSFATLLAAWMF